jgi:hypothetical protein
MRVNEVQHVARMSVATCGAVCEVNPDVAIARRKTRVTALMAHPDYACCQILRVGGARLLAASADFAAVPTHHLQNDAGEHDVVL